MENYLTTALYALKEHCERHGGTADKEAADKTLRTELKKLTKDELIEKIVAMSSKPASKLIQADLLADIYSDARCAVLTYEEIRDGILSNIKTDMKFSIANLSWYRTNLRTKGYPILLQTPKHERDAMDRQLMKQLLK